MEREKNEKLKREKRSARKEKNVKETGGYMIHLIMSVVHPRLDLIQEIACGICFLVTMMTMIELRS